MLRRTKLMFHELQLARDDIAAQFGNISGRIVVGALPLASTLLVPRAATRLKQEYPDLQITRPGGHVRVAAGEPALR